MTFRRRRVWRLAYTYRPIRGYPESRTALAWALRTDRHPYPKRVYGRARAEAEWLNLWKGASDVSV